MRSRLTVHVNPSRWTENILKAEHFENDAITMTEMVSLPSFPQTQIQNDRLLQNIIDAFSEWNVRFQIPQSGVV